jgi:hypothetical protein
MNKTTIKKYMHIAGHFNGRGGAPVQCRVHHPMEEDYGFPRSHWTLPSGKYLLQ